MPGVIPYKVSLDIDNQQALKKLLDVNTKMTQLENGQILIDFKYNKNIKDFNKKAAEISKLSPDLGVQFQYDVNKRGLLQAKEQLTQLTDLQVGVDTLGAKEYIKQLTKEVKDLFDDAASEQQLAAPIQKLLNTVITLDKDLLPSIQVELGDIYEEFEELSKLKPISLMNMGDIDDLEHDIKGFESALEKLKKQGAIDVADKADNKEIAELTERVSILEDRVLSLQHGLLSLSGEGFINASDSADVLLSKLVEIAKTLEIIPQKTYDVSKAVVHNGNISVIGKKERVRSDNMGRLPELLMNGMGHGSDFFFSTPPAADVASDTFGGLTNGFKGLKTYIIDLSKLKKELHQLQFEEQAAEDEAIEALKSINAFAFKESAGIDKLKELGIETKDTSRYGYEIPDTIEDLYNIVKNKIPDMSLTLKEFNNLLQEEIQKLNSMGEITQKGFYENQEKFGNEILPSDKLLEKLGYTGFTPISDGPNDGSGIGGWIINVEKYLHNTEDSIEYIKSFSEKQADEAEDYIANIDQHFAELNNQLKEKFKEYAVQIIQLAKTLGENIANGLADGIDAHSDSKKAIKSGEDFVNGVTHSIEDNTDEAVSAAKQLGEKVSDALDESLNNINDDTVSLSVSSPTQVFDNEIQQNLVMLENYENTIKEINKLSELGLDTDEAKKKLEELNKLADYFAAQITVIRSENGHFVNSSMMYFNGLPNTNLTTNYDWDAIKRFTQVAHERSGLSRDNVSKEFYGIEDELQRIENASEGLKNALTKDLSTSKKYVSRVKADLLGLVEMQAELSHTSQKSNPKDFALYNELFEKFAKRSPELLQFLDKLKTYEQATDFVKTDEWLDFLATLPKAHDYLESIGYDFEKIPQKADENLISSTIEEIIPTVNNLDKELQEAGQQGEVASDKIQTGLTDIKNEAEKAEEAIQRVTYHYGNLSNGKPSHPFGGEIKSWFSGIRNGGRGWADGTGTYVTSNINEYKKGGDYSDPLKKFYAIDTSKLKLYEQHIEENAQAYYEFSHRLEQFSYKIGAGFDGFDENLKNVDPTSLYKEVQNLFGKTAITFEEFDAFLKEMTNLVKESGIKADGSSDAMKMFEFKKKYGSDDIKTRFLQKLGYQGTDFSGTTFDSIRDGSVLFQNAEKNIIKSGSSIEEVMVEIQQSADKVGESVNTAAIALNDLNASSLSDDDIIDKFKELVQVAKDAGVSLATFLEKIKNGNIPLNDSIKETISLLGILQGSNYTNTPITNGTRHKDGFVSKDYTVISRYIDYIAKTEALIPKLKEAEKAGANVGTILGVIKDESQGLFYEIQKTQKGKLIDKDNLEFLQATDEQIIKLKKDVEAIAEAGLFFDVKGKNFLYDKNAGFSFIDMAVPKDLNDIPKYNKNTIDSLFNALEWYLPKNTNGDSLQVIDEYADKLNHLRDVALNLENVQKNIDKTPDLFEGKSGQLSFIENLTEAEEKASTAAEELVDDLSRVKDQIDGQMSFDDLQRNDQIDYSVQSEEKLLPMVIESTDAIEKRNEEMRRMQAIQQAFMNDIGQSNEAKINRDITATLEQRRKEQEKLNEAKQEEVSTSLSSPIAEVDIKAEESAKAAEKEAEAMTEVKEESEMASTSKKGFAKANAEVLQSIKESLSGLTDEAELFKALNNIINKFSGKGSDERISTLANNIIKIKDALSGSIDDNSFIDALQKLSEQGENLKNLASVLKASKKQIESVKDSIDDSNELSLEDRDALAHQIAQSQEYEREQKKRLEQEKEIERARKEGQKQAEAYAKQQLDEQNKLTSSIENYSKKLQDAITADEIAKQTGAGVSKDLVNRWEALKADLSNIDITADTSKAQEELEKLKEKIDIALSPKERKFEKVIPEEVITNLGAQIEDFGAKNTRLSKELSERLEEVRRRYQALFNSGSTGDALERELKSISSELNKIKTEANAAGQAGKNFGHMMLDSLKSANARFIANYLSIQDMIRYVRTAFETIHQLDTALVDLKKTTTMSNSELEDFYHNSSRIAKQMGVSSQEIISQASAWSRLGYNTKETSETMAELSSQFAKISPGTSVEDATDYLVSTMKAFDIDVTKVESDIMDSINRIGNTMATSNQEVGEMLKRSSAAMAAANNSLAETIALESAAVQITRNAETTGINSAA